jgi:hypothetical protein
MKEDMAWHKKCLANREEYMHDKEKKVWEMQKEISRELEEISFYKIQIAMAEASGRTGFDRDRFCRHLKRT